MYLYEILVPCQTNEGRAIRTRQHREWDARVRRITGGGMTILTPAKGHWVAPNGKLFSERMIPVRIATTQDCMERIADMTAKFYGQLAIMYYKISEDVTIKEYPLDTTQITT